MCLGIYLATDEPINSPYDPAVGGLGWLRQLPAKQVAEFPAITKPYLYLILFEHGCGCLCERPDGPLRPALVKLLQWALRSVPVVELYTCQQGHERLEPKARDWCMPTELLHLQVFEGGELLAVYPDA
jgi:hypothetical protein